MNYQSELAEALKDLLGDGIDIKDVDEKAKEISKKYRANNNGGKRLVTKCNEATAYALSRMPATYGAVSECIKNVLENNEINVKSVLDIGAGTGAATWAINNFFDDADYTCLEREPEMISIGMKLMENTSLSSRSNWSKFDILEGNICNKYDFVVSSYMINELPKDKVEAVINKMWEATNNTLLIIEPGTPNGFSNILKIRNLLTERGAHIIAPCTHQEECQIQDGDWCQFTCRVQRSKVHKQLKDGSSPYEDEKYSYIAFSKKECNRAQYRILRHPIINKGYSEYKVCSRDGIKRIKLSKKDGKIYKEAKKKNAGDSLTV